MSKQKPTYAGKIGNGGAQEVKAPFENGRKPDSRVIRGTDLTNPKQKKNK